MPSKRSDMPGFSVQGQTPLRIGDSLPPAKITLHGSLVNLKEYFHDRTGVLFGVRGAYVPMCTKVHAPGIRDSAEEIRRCVDFVGCVVVNDPFVVKAWAKKLNVTDQFTFIADANCEFAEALGMVESLPELGLGLRSRRFALVIGPKAKVRWVGFDQEALAEEVQRRLPIYIRTPWKSVLIAATYDDTSEAEELRTTEALDTMRKFTMDLGFSHESDWQQILMNTLGDSRRPTRKNLEKGLKWLVNSVQAGDCVLLYFVGRGTVVADENGNKVAALVPIDHETEGVVSEQFLYDTLVASVPEGCRLSVVLDTYSTDGSVDASYCSLPYVTRMTAGGRVEQEVCTRWEGRELRKRSDASAALEDVERNRNTQIRREKRDEMLREVKSEVLFVEMKVPTNGNPAVVGAFTESLVRANRDFRDISNERLLEELQKSMTEFTPRTSDAEPRILTTVGLNLQEDFSLMDRMVDVVDQPQPQQ